MTKPRKKASGTQGAKQESAGASGAEEWRQKWNSQFISLYDLLDTVDSGSHQNAAALLFNVFQFEVDVQTGSCTFKWLYRIDTAPDSDWLRLDGDARDRMLELSGLARGFVNSDARRRILDLYGLCRNEIAGMLEKHGVKVPPSLRIPADSGNFKQAALDEQTSKLKRRDLIRLEIEAVLEQRGQNASASLIMQILRSRAGQAGSCVKEVTQDGVKWLDSRRNLHLLSLRNLQDRLSRAKPAR